MAVIGNALPVYICSGSGVPTDGTAPLPVTGFSNRVILTPTVTAGAYSSGNCLGGLNSIALAPNVGQSGLLQSFDMNSTGGLTATITVYLFDSNPTGSTFTDKGTFTLVTADKNRLIIPPFALTLAAPTGTSMSFASLSQITHPFIAGGATTSGVNTIYVALVAGGTFTPSSTSDISVLIGAAF